MITIPKGAVKARKRLGRGAGSRTGCTAGRGTKGQRARSGGSGRPGFEGGQMPLYRRVPRRGFSNYPFKQKPVILSLASLDVAFLEAETITLQKLREKKLIKNKDDFVKILADGEVKRVFTISKEVKVSSSAKDKIIKAGGSVEESEVKTVEKGKLTKKLYRKQLTKESVNKKGMGSVKEDSAIVEQQPEGLENAKVEGEIKS